MLAWLLVFTDYATQHAAGSQAPRHDLFNWLGAFFPGKPHAPAHSRFTQSWDYAGRVNWSGVLGVEMKTLPVNSNKPATHTGHVALLNRHRAGPALVCEVLV